MNTQIWIMIVADNYLFVTITNVDDTITNVANVTTVEPCVLPRTQLPPAKRKLCPTIHQSP